jgi:hypothetical protein
MWFWRGVRQDIQHAVEWVKIAREQVEGILPPPPAGEYAVVVRLKEAERLLRRCLEPVAGELRKEDADHDDQADRREAQQEGGCV